MSENQQLAPVPVNLYPRHGVVDTSISERAMGRLLNTTVPLPSLTVSPSINDLTSDVFFSLYKAEPKPVDNRPSSRYLNAALMRLLHNAPNFESMRSSTIGDIPAAMVSTSTVVSTLMSDESVKEAMRMQERLEKLMEELNELRQQMAQAGDDGRQQSFEEHGNQQTGSGSGDKPQQQQPQQQQQQPQQPHQQQSGGTGDGQQDKQSEKQKRTQQRQKNIKTAIKKKEKEVERVQQQMEERSDKLEQNPMGKGMASASMSEGKKSNEKLKSMMSSWGIEPGEMSYSDANFLAQLATDQESNLSLIAEVGGRVAGVSAETLQAVRDSYVGAPSEPTYTRDILRMFPMERAYMSHHAPPVIRSMKIVQWAQRGVLGLRPKSEGKKRGALVIAVDGSSSMNVRLCAVESSTGEKRTIDRGDTSKMLALGVARAMREDRFEKRRYTMFTFSSSSDAIRATRSSDEWQDLLSWVQYDPNGGTDFAGAFRFALREMERFEAEGTLGADLLFISDGEDRLDNSTKQRISDYKDRTGARVFYIQVADSNHASGYTPESCNLDGIVDSYVVITDGGDIDDVPGHLAQQVSSVFAQVG